MALVAPFKGLRFTQKAGRIEELTCPPYDIISEEERKNYLSRNAHNVIRLELPREGEDPYAQAGRVLEEWIASGIVATEEKESLYVYEEEFSHRGERLRIRGVICKVRLEEFEKGIILPHEETLSKAKNDRFHLMEATHCNFSQIYSLYMDEDGSTARAVDQLAQGAPLLSLTDGEGVEHRLWASADPAAVSAVCTKLANKKLYIADGHHRYETALNYRNALREQGKAKEGDECDYVMMMLVSLEHPGLVVFPTHRVVRGLSGFDPKQLLESASALFESQPAAHLSDAQQKLDAAYSAGRSAFALYQGGQFTLLTLRDSACMEQYMPGASPALRGLDVSVLHTLILERALGIDQENMKNQKNLLYTRDAQQAVTLVDSGEANCAFLLNPTRVEEIRDVALAGEKMPQKSTYFYPKLITGLVMRRMHP